MSLETKKHSKHKKQGPVFIVSSRIQNNRKGLKGENDSMRLEARVAAGPCSKGGGSGYSVVEMVMAIEKRERW